VILLRLAAGAVNAVWSLVSGSVRTALRSPPAVQTASVWS